MPLPEASTIENSAILDQQANPAFMNEPITSPTQSGPKPIIPLTQFVGPNNEQGGVEDPGPKLAQNSTLTQDLVNRVRRTSGSLPVSQNNLPQYRKEDVNQPRYPQYLPGGQNEEVYGLNQGPLTQLKNGIVKGVALGLGTFAEGMMTIPDTMHAIASGKMSELYNTDLNNHVANWMKNLEDSLPNYVTQAQQNRGLWNVIPFSGGSANFWGNTIVKNLGMMAGAVGSALVQDAAIGALTEGIGDIPLLATQFGKASIWLNKILTGSERVAQTVADATKLGRTGEQIMDLQKIQLASTLRKIGSRGEYMTNLFSSARTMSVGGAQQQYGDMKENLTNEYIRKNGYAPAGDDAQKIEDTAIAAANTKFAVDTGLMMIQESVSLDNILKRGGTSTGKYVSEAQRKLGVNLEGIQPVAGVAGKYEYIAPTGINKVFSALKPFAPTILSTGAVMGAMYGSQVATRNFYEDKYNGKINGNLADIVNSIGDGLSAAYGSKEGLEQVFIGGLTGALMGIGTKVAERIARGGVNADQIRAQVIDMLNKETVSGFMKNNHEAAAKSMANAEKMKAANDKGDAFEYDNLQHDEFVNFAINHAKNKMADVGFEKLQGLKELSKEEFVKQWAMDDTPENRQIASEYIDKLLGEYKNIIKTRDLIGDTFTNPFDPKESAEEGATYNKYDVFENWKDTLTKYASVARNVADRVGTIRKSASNLYSLASPEMLMDLTDPSKLRDYNTELKAKARDLNDSLKDDTSPARKDDRAHLAFLNKLTDDVDNILAKHNPDNIHQVYSDLSDMDTFQKLMAYKSTGDPKTSLPLEAPKESLAHLAGYGGDLNKLDILKTQAGHAYDLLSTKEGFEKFYNAEVERMKNRQKPEEPVAAEPVNKPVGGLPSGTPDTGENKEPVEKQEVKQFKVTNPYTGKDRYYNEGDDIYIPQKKGNPVKAKVVSLNPDATLTIEYSDGTKANLKPEDLFEGVKKKTAEEKKQATPPPPPAGTTIEQADTRKSSGDSVPDITIGLKSGSTPRWGTPVTYDNNFHQRLQSFLYRAGSSNPKVFLPTYRGQMYIQYVTPKTQEALGFPKNWIENTGGDTNAIRLVHIIQDETGLWYATENGDKGKKVGEPGMTGEEAIYSSARTAELVDPKYGNRYTNKEGVDEKEYAALWEGRRKFILDQSTPATLEPTRFSVSRGVADKNNAKIVKVAGPDGAEIETKVPVKNSVVKVGLIDTDDLFKPVVQMATTEDLYVLPLEDETLEPTKEIIAPNEKNNGKVFLNHGLNFTWLNNFHLSESEASKVVDLMKFHSDKSSSDGDKELAKKAIKQMAYTLIGESKTAPKPNTISLPGDGTLLLGQDPNPIDYSPESIEANRAKIEQFLQTKAYHNVDRIELNKITNKAKDPDKESLIYKEYHVQDGKLEKREWPTYNHYLLSDEGGRTPPLSTNISIPTTPGEPPIKNKYVTLRDFEFPEAPPAKTITVTAVPPKEEIPLGEIAMETKDTEGKAIKRFYQFEPVLDGKGNIIGMDPTKPFGYRVGKVEDKSAPEGAQLIAPKNPSAVQKFIEDQIAANLPPKDITNTDKDDLDFLGSDIKPPTGIAFSWTDVLPTAYEKIDIDKEIAEIREDLGEDFPIHDLNHVIQVTSGGYAYGAFYNNAIYIWNEGKQGTGYHEAFEKVFNQFLPAKDQLALYREFRERKGSFKTFEGTYKTFESATFKEAKEQMADEFADFRTGKEGVPPKQKSFFRRLIDFIKRIIFGDKNKINDLFDRIYRKQYRNFSSKGEDDASRPPQYREDDGLNGMSEAFVQHIMQGMTAKMMSLVYGKNRDLIESVETGKKTSAKDIYDQLYEELKNYYTGNQSGANIASVYNEKFLANKDNPGVQDQIRAEVAKIRGEVWPNIQAKWKSLVEKHKETLRPLNIRFTTDVEGTTTVDDLEDYVSQEDRGVNDFLRDDMKFNSMKSSAFPVKLAYFTAAQWARNAKGEMFSKIENSLAKLPLLYPGVNLWNYTLHNAAGINGIFEMWNKLSGVAKGNKPIELSLQSILNRADPKQEFKENGFANMEIPDIRFMIQIGSAFNVNKPAFLRQVLNKDGQIFNIDAPVNDKAAAIREGWIAKMKNAPGVNAYKDGFSFKPIKKEGDYYLAAAKSLGIDISKKAFDNLRTSIKNGMREQIGAIVTQVNKMAEAGTKVGFVSGDIPNHDFKNRLVNLADLYANYITGDDTQSQHNNLEGKPTSSFIRNNALSYMLNEANNSKNLEEFYSRAPHMTDIFRKNSYVINDIIFSGKDNGFVRRVGTAIVEGRQQSGKSVATSKLTINERIIYEFNSNLAGAYYTLVPGDGKNEHALKATLFINPETFFKGNREQARQKFGEIMYGYLNTEVELARDYSTNPTRAAISNLGKSYRGRVRGNSLRFFSDILPEKIVDRIHKEVIDGNSDIASVITPADMAGLMDVFSKEKARATVKSMINGGVFGFDAESQYITPNGVDRTFLNAYVGEADRVSYPGREIVDVAQFREMNYIIGNIEQHKLLFGDPAQYNDDELKRTKSFLGGVEPIHVDNEPGEKGLNGKLNNILNLAHGTVPLEPKDPGYHQFKNHANTVTLYDIEVVSSSYDHLKSILGEEKAKPYLNVNEADAQAIHSPGHHREVLWKSGSRFNDKLEKDFQWQYAMERLALEEEGKYVYTNDALKKADSKLREDQPLPNFDATYPVLKLKAAGSTFTDGTTVDHINKASWAMQFRSWMKGRQGVDLYDAMQEAGIDYVLVKSAHKLGVAEGSIVPLYTPDGKINKEGIKNAQIQEIPHQILGIQVEAQTKNNGVTQGSQLRSLAPQGLYSNGIPADYDGEDAWDKLTDDEKIKASAIHKVVEDHNETLRQMVIKRTDLKLAEMGIKENEDGTVEIPDMERVAKFFENELTRRELPDNIARGLKVDPRTGQFYSPLESNIRYKQLWDIGYSIMDKTVLRPKMNGNMMTIQSVSGWETGPRQYNSKGQLLSSELPFYSQEKDGSTKPAGYLIPNYFGKEVRDNIMKKHDLKTEADYNTHLYNHLRGTADGRRLLRSVGFRIPLQADNSIEIAEAKGLLSTQMGNRVIYGSEITAKAGLDMDFDKQNLYLRNFYVNSEGYPQLIKFENIDTNDETALSDLYDRVYSGDRIMWEAYQKDPSRFIDKALDEALGESSEPDYVPTKAEFIRDAKGSSPYKFNSIKAIENKYYDVLEKIMLMKEKYKSLVTPNNADELEAVANSIDRKLNPEGSEGNGPYGSLLDSLYMTNKRQSFLDAKGGIAVTASSNSTNAVRQLIPFVYTGKLDVKFPHNEIGGQVSFSKSTSANGDSIANAISQTLDGFADVTKKDFLSKMGVNNDTAKNWIFLLSAGVDKKTAALFMNQPAIREFLRLQAIHRNVSGLNKNVQAKSNDYLFSDVASMFGGSVNRKAFRKDKSVAKLGKFTDKEMDDMMTSYGKGEGLSEIENKRQLQMLDFYMQYDSVAWDLFKVNQGFNWTTDRGADPNMTRRKLILYNRAKELPFTNVDKLLEHSFVGEYKTQNLRINDGLKEVFIIQSGKTGDVMDQEIERLATIKSVNTQYFQKAAAKINLSLLDYVIQTKTKVNGNSLNSYIEPLMSGPYAIAKFVEALKSSEDDHILANSFLNAVRTRIDKREGYPSFIELIEKDTDTLTSDRLTAALRELRDDQGTSVTVNGITKSAAQIYQGIKLAGIIQSGSQSTSTSYSHLIPNEDYGPVVSTAIGMKDQEAFNFHDNDIAFRTLWMDDKLVPVVAKVYIDNPTDPSKSLAVSPRFNNKKFYESLGKNISSLQLDHYQYKGQPFVKTVDSPEADKEGNIPDKVERLYRRVDIYGEPAIVYKPTLSETGNWYNAKTVVYVEINKWGSRDINEYHENGVESVLPMNPAVEEVTNDEALAAIIQSGVKHAIPKEYWENANLHVDDQEEPTVTEEDGDVEPDQKSDASIIKELEDKKAIDRDCTGTKPK